MKEINSKISSLIQAIIPTSDPDKTFNSFIKFLESINEKNKLESIYNAIQMELETLSSIDEKESFPEYLGIILKKMLKTHPREMMLLTELYCDYLYTDSSFRNKMGITNTSPFPEGNIINDFDFSLLEEVYLRGKKYREV